MLIHNQQYILNMYQLQDNPTNLKDFQIIKKIGEGAYSQVFKVKRLHDGQIYAMKKVRMGQLKQKERENALNEVRILASFDEPYIIKYKEAFIDEDVLCIVMEFAENGDLQNIVKSYQKQNASIPEKNIWTALYHMLKGISLKKLHEIKIVHRDLKCANIFLSDNIYKLGDLNVSKVAKNGLVQTQTGTPYYASPEVWKDKPYDQRSDIWSLGCVIYEMAAQRPPFKAQDMKALYRRVLSGKFDPIPKSYSRELLSIISSCLQVEPSKRPTCIQLLNNPMVLKNIDGASIDQHQTMKGELLGTIMLPKNLKSLKGKLPQSKYEDHHNRSFSEERIKPQPKPARAQSACNHILQSNLKVPTKKEVLSPINYDQIPSAPRPEQKPKQNQNIRTHNSQIKQRNVQKSEYQSKLEEKQKELIYQEPKSLPVEHREEQKTQNRQMKGDVDISKNIPKQNESPIKKQQTEPQVQKQKEVEKSISEKKIETTQEIKKVEPVVQIEKIKEEKKNHEEVKEKDHRQSIKEKGQEDEHLVVSGLVNINPQSIQSILCQPVLQINDNPFPVQAKVVHKSKQVKSPQVQMNQKKRPESAQLNEIEQPMTKKNEYYHYYPVTNLQKEYLDKLKLQERQAQQRLSEQSSMPQLNSNKATKTNSQTEHVPRVMRQQSANYQRKS